MAEKEGKYNMTELRENLLHQYLSLISNQNIIESSLQSFLENNSELIPLPFLLNHYLHHNAVISKLPISSGKISDFAYLTKSSDEWYVVLIELERSNKKLFNDNRENVQFSADFNNAYDQITSWKAILNNDRYRASLLNSIDKIRHPLNENRVSFKYVLIIGRSAEKDAVKARKNMFAQKNTDDTIVMTYDSIISYAQSVPYIEKKLILSPWQEQGFAIKILPENVETSIFSYVENEFLKLTKSQINQLKEYGYDIDAWLDGKLLNLNSKRYIDFSHTSSFNIQPNSVPEN